MIGMPANGLGSGGAMAPSARFSVLSDFRGRQRRTIKNLEDFLVLYAGVRTAVSASLARQIENAVNCPDRVEGAAVAALERHSLGKWWWIPPSPRENTGLEAARRPVLPRGSRG